MDVGTSVSRVGGDAQVEAMKKVASKLRLGLASFRELQNFARLGTELDAAAQAQLDRGSRMVELLKQPQFAPMSVGEQVISIFLGGSGLLDDVPVNNVSKFAAEFLQWLSKEHPDYAGEITRSGKFSDELVKKATEAANTFKTIKKQ
jgi:F-type H+-transporting ATPase subunit alpha